MAKTEKTETPATRERLIQSNVAGETLTLTFAGEGEIVINLSDLSADVKASALMHGLRQKIADAAAAPKGTPNSDRFAAMVGIADALKAGNWTQRVAGEGGGAQSGLIFRAFSQWVAEQSAAKGKPAPTAERIREVFEGKTHAEKLALRTVPAIAAIMDTLRTAKAPKIDGDDLLGDFL